MLTVIIIFAMLFLILFFLYCLLSVKTDSERALDDEEQAAFFENYKLKK